MSDAEVREAYMQQLLFLVIIGGFFGRSFLAQGPDTNACRVTIEQFAIRGLKLGMTPSQVLDVLPTGGDKEDLAGRANSPNRDDLANLEYYPSTYGNPTQFVGVYRMVLFFYRGTLADFTIYYSSPNQGGVSWPNLDAYISKIAEGLRLPGPQAWISGPHNERVLKCAGLELQVADTNHLRIMKLGFPDEIESRKKAEEDKKRQAFHP
jgi:hypothetical protein